MIFVPFIRIYWGEKQGFTEIADTYLGNSLKKLPKFWNHFENFFYRSSIFRKINEVMSYDEITQYFTPFLKVCSIKQIAQN